MTLKSSISIIMEATRKRIPMGEILEKGEERMKRTMYADGEEAVRESAVMRLMEKSVVEERSAEDELAGYGQKER